MDNIPRNLHNILDMLFTNNAVRNFNLYSEKSGLVLKIRFNDCNGGSNIPGMQTDHVSFMKKSPSRQNRDAQRYQKFNSDRRTTRSMKGKNSDSIEQPRSDEGHTDISIAMSHASV